VTEEDPRINRPEAQYTNHGTETENCGRCTHFDRKAACHRIQGAVVSEGWCRYYRNPWPTTPSNHQQAGAARRTLIDRAVMERAAQIGCTIAETAALLGIAANTFSSHLQHDPNLREHYDRARDKGKETLRRWQWRAAEEGNPTMLIWLGKQMLGQKDKRDDDDAGTAPVRVIVELVGEAAPVRLSSTAAPAPAPLTPFGLRLIQDVEIK
jgi:hypothetical protein